MTKKIEKIRDQIKELEEEITVQKKLLELETEKEKIKNERRNKKLKQDDTFKIMNEFLIFMSKKFEIEINKYELNAIALYLQSQEDQENHYTKFRTEYFKNHKK